jgi:hypothetical protein
MKSTSVLSAAALCLVSACSDSIPVEPTTAALSAFSARASAISDEQFATVDPNISNIALDVGRPVGDYMIVRAELLHDVNALSNQSANIIIANDRTKLTEAQWVPGDPRRGGLPGLRWGYVGLEDGVEIFDPGVIGFLRGPNPGELEARVVEGMAAWEGRKCSSSPIQRLTFEDPGVPDIFQVGWLSADWFEMTFPTLNTSAILGVTLTSVFVNSLTDLTPTDIDGNGRPDIAFQDIIYNAGGPATPTMPNRRKIWSNNGPLGTTDLFSVITHESGHAFGLDHFGKVFVKTKDLPLLQNGDVSVIKYAPRSMMNAVYVTGRSEISGTDNAAFCQIWAGK